MTAILDLLRNWRIMVPLVIVIMLLSIYLWRGKLLDITREKLSAAQTEVTQLQGDAAAQNAAVATWQDAGRRQAAQVKRAQISAAKTFTQAQATAYLTLSSATPVPAHCEQAAQWAVARAHELNAEWRGR